jgi:membrane protease YdiL (CAAX protease family)
MMKIGKFEIDKARLEAPVALIYTAAMLTVMEYFLLAQRIEPRIHPQNWRGVPSLEAGVAWAMSCVVCYLIIPALISRFIFGRKLRENGYSAKDFLSHLKSYFRLFALMAPLIYLASQQAEFTQVYPFVPDARLSQQNFFIWELAYACQFIALESFFRGYLLNTLDRSCDRWVAITVMVVPYGMIHFHKPFPEAMGAIVAGVVLGALSLRYKSWYGGAVLHVLVAVLHDTLSVFTG